MKYLRLLHDNAPAHRARIGTEYLEAEKVTVIAPSEGVHILYTTR